MAASAAQIAQLRRMCAELGAETYSDATLAAYIEARPMRDMRGEPYLTTLGFLNVIWEPTYDLNGAAADIWDEKAGALIEEVDTTVDGTSLARSQVYEHARKRASHYRSRAAIRSVPELSRRDEATRHALRWNLLGDEEDYGIVDGMSGDVMPGLADDE